MTLSNLVSTGSGKLAARWEIEGLPIEFCTDPGMEQTLADGRVRLCCTSLGDCGFSIEEMANLPEATLEAKSTSLTLWETVDEQLSAVFHYRPDVERFGFDSITDSDTSITLYSTEGITSGDVLHLGSEAVKVNTVGSTSITLSNRAYWGTVAAYHYGSDTAGHPDLLITNRPLRVRGRQVRLWLYGDGDDLQGDGYLRWLGIVNAEPMLVSSGTQYRLSFGPITDRLKTKIGGDLDTPVTPAGVYYTTGAALRIQITEYLSGGGFNQGTGTYTGFSATQVQFADALTSWLATLVSDNSLDSLYEAESTEDGRWTIRCTVGASTTSLSIHVWSEQDGQTSLRPDDMLVDSPTGTPVGTGTLSSGNFVYPAWVSGPPGGRAVPRGYFGFSSTVQLHDGSAASTAPAYRIYTSRPPDSGWSAVTVDWKETGGSSSSVLPLLTPGSNYIVFDTIYVAGEQHVYTPAQLAEIRVAREVARGGLADLLNSLVGDAPQFANLGALPFLTSRDIGSYTGPISRNEPFSWQSNRLWAFTKGVDFDELLSHELRLRSLFLITDTNGKMSVAELTLPSGLTATTFAIDEEILTVDGQAQELSSMARGNQTVNRVVLHTDYDVIEDRWNATREVQDRRAFALDHQDRPLDIKPYSRPQRYVDIEELASAVLPVLGIFGYPHEFVTVKVTWKAFNVRLGDAVSFSANHLPSYTSGARPISSVKALVVGRKWQLGEAYGELTLLLSWQNVAGYAPTARVSSQVNDVGDQWTLTINTSLFFASGEDPTDHFSVGDKVTIVQVDSETATTVTGTVDAVTATTIQVTFDATWTPGSDTWDLRFQAYTNATNSGQTDYAFYAGTDLVLGSTDAPRTLAP